MSKEQLPLYKETIRDLCNSKDPFNYFNNFYLNLPACSVCGGQSGVFGKTFGTNRSIIEQLGRIDKRIGDDLRGRKEGYGTKCLGQTYEEFFQTIARTIDELNLREEIHGCCGLDPRGNPEDAARIINTVLPLYVRLRELGYAWYDLCG